MTVDEAVAAGDRHQQNLRAADTAFTMLRGTSLTSVAILWGLPLALFGRAVRLEGYPFWLGWTELAVGAATIVGATTRAGPCR